MDRFGDVLYNLYGSTEVALGDDRLARRTCAPRPAPPAARRSAPSSSSSTSDGREVAAGETGRIFVGNELVFDGYTGGGNKAIIDGLMSTGDVGHFDDDGRLFVDGRDDEMIVSGGENVFPREVEDLLADHDGGRRGRGRRRRRREVRPAAEGVRRLAPTRALTEDELKDYVKSNLAPYKVPREIECSSTSCRATRRARSLKRELAGAISERPNGRR